MTTTVAAAATAAKTTTTNKQTKNEAGLSWQSKELNYTCI
jgi:hypothetical protein